jgi:hypothetical protein
MRIVELIAGGDSGGFFKKAYCCCQGARKG